MTFDELVTERDCFRAQLKKMSRENEDLAAEARRYRELYISELSRREAVESARDYLGSKRSIVNRSARLLGRIAHRVLVR